MFECHEFFPSLAPAGGRGGASLSFVCRNPVLSPHRQSMQQRPGSPNVPRRLKN
jgi:hypothetical protein